MTFFIALILFLIFLFLSSIHFYWAFGGKWGSTAVIPTKDDVQPAMNPGIIATLIVAFGLFGFGILPLIVTGTIPFQLPHWLEESALWIIAGIFLFRAIGDFNYVGFFKKRKDTAFGKNDTKYYSPLCLLIGVLAVVLMLFTS
ncbi:MAG: hypothetical protein K0S23_1128 [Fluviicola sp.]|jgi:hypothetical protein|uniref:DUF3995 domain-containing protein n=1 Tax=Fluviicola sp. TaxID=1917219 RepID=UPI00260F1DE1|nr:DUF3995 domain-containing protein [Fluviicola sp.]MDF3026821.1 hypothetical protein [Fluviicola sp.]